MTTVSLYTIIVLTAYYNRHTWFSALVNVPKVNVIPTMYTSRICDTIIFLVARILVSISHKV